MNDKPRLIEVAFPLKQTSLDSVHEKNVRHGHISTLHIWPARRPLAACRAALIATLLPDPGDAEERAKILEKLAGHVVPTVKKKKMPSGKIEEIKAEETVGGILHWGRESGPDLDWFREEIRKAYGGRAPKVLDPFAGGGAIPLEAMRLGCEATAIDINPVAWFVLKCTLEYPQKLAGQKLALPDFALRDREFMAEYFERCLGLKGASLKRRLKQHFGEHEQDGEFHELRESASAYATDLQADLAWQVRAWGRWVLKQARKELAVFYPTYATWEPVLETEKRKLPKDWLVRWKKDHAAEITAKGLRLCPLTVDGEVDEKMANEEFTADYLAEPTNPRWVPKQTVAYLWARTVKNKHHGETTIPLLKTRWFCKKDDKRVLLTMVANADGTGVDFGIENDVPKVGGNTAQRREHDKRIAAGTMSRAGVMCPIHGNILTMEDIRLEGQAERLGTVMTAVIVDGPLGKEYRLPTPLELAQAERAGQELTSAFADIPFGMLNEPTPQGGGTGAGRAFSVRGYGQMKWSDLFTERQLFVLAKFVKHTRAVRELMSACGFSPEWREAIGAYLAIPIDKVAAFNCRVTRWFSHREGMCPIFSGYRIEMMWDHGEINPLSESTGAYGEVLQWIERVVGPLCAATSKGKASVMQTSAKKFASDGVFDLVLTDPPYYDAIPYSDLMDFFYLWLRRTLNGISTAHDQTFNEPLAPKWNHQENDGELIDDDSRHDGDAGRSKKVYEDGMASVFAVCHRSLNVTGRMVVVFANKEPDAWETLVSAVIRAGFVVDGSWPIQTEMGARSRALASAALSSSVWLICKKRSAVARPGWDNTVLAQMRERIAVKLRDFWDAGIRGPDFVWAATGPAMESYSQYPVVKKANKPNELMSVSEFLRHVRRMVLDFVVGRVLSKATGGSEAAVGELDDVTTYYLLHRNDFKMGDAPAGACILYAVSCNLSDRDLVDAFDLLVPSGGTSDGDEDDEESGDDDAEMAEGTSSTFKLKPWNKRKRAGLGYESVLVGRKPEAGSAAAGAASTFAGSFAFVNQIAGQQEFMSPGLIPAPVAAPAATDQPRRRIVPLIDQIHRLMHIWRAGDVAEVDKYLEERALRGNALFPPVLQAVIEMAEAGSEERSILESLSNHVQGRSVRAGYQQELAVSAQNKSE